MQFAKLLLESDGEYLVSIIYSDEITVEQFPRGRELHHRVHSSIKPQDMPVNPQVQGSGFKAIFWGCISVHGVGPLVPLTEGTMKTPGYCTLLRQHFHPYLRQSHRDNGQD